ncbi:hypothetical protein NUH87_01775 [Pseudomonas batumici]|uniref:hypothetical protein n=1 Tax=Pseudomonas batumici TaxID=226910 RepID=UPI0030CCAD07
MENLFWERDYAGSKATYTPAKTKYVSPQAARFLVKRLMHEASTISASFGVHELVVFSRLLGVSEFDETGGSFYGLYSSGHDEQSSPPLPNYCLRKLQWTKGFKNIDTVLQGLTSTSLFFHSDSLDRDSRTVFEDAEAPLGNKLDITHAPADAEVRSEKIINYFAMDDATMLQGEYQAPAVFNPYIENKIQELSKLFDALFVDGGILPDVNSLRISYTFDHFDFMKS